MEEPPEGSGLTADAPQGAEPPPDVLSVEAPSWIPAAPAPVPSRRGLMIGIAAVLVAGGAATGVFLALSGRTSSPPAALKAGWTSRAVPSEGFSVGLPPGWTAVPTTSADDALKALKDANPDLASIIQQQGGVQLSSLIKLLAFDTKSATLARQFATNMNVVVIPVPSGVGFEEFLQQNLTQLRSVPNFTAIQTQRVELPSGQGALVSSQLTLKTSSGSQVIAISQYVVLGEGRGYLISFSTLPDALDGYAPLFAEIAKTFRKL